MYYKSLTPDRKSWYDGITAWEPGKPMPLLSGGVNGPCGAGAYHFAKTIGDAVGYGRFPLSLWTAKPMGEKLWEDETKVRYTGGMIVEEIPKPAWILRAEKFLEAVKDIKWLEGHGEVDQKWKMFATSNDAWAAAAKAISENAAARCVAKETTWDAAKIFAGAAARDAAEDAARYVACGPAEDVVRGIVGTAIWKAVGGVANDTAWIPVRDAARDAALMARMEICCDLPVPQKCRQYMEDRWAVWRAGYGCLCDVDGVLYCYRRV